MRKLNLFLLPLLLIAVSACKLDRSNLPPSTGKTNEMLIVTNSEGHWLGKTGQVIQGFFGQMQKGLPQPEPMYDLVHVPEPNFAKLLQTHHNIFIVDINSSFTEPVIETKKDYWAKPQRVAKMTVPSEEVFLTQFDLYKEAFIELFNENERQRANHVFASIEDFTIKNQIITTFDLDLSIPKGFRIATKTPNFIWIRRETDRFGQGILIYYSPYTDTSNFNYERLIIMRDTVTKKFIPGPTDKSYMKISMNEPPVAKRIDFKGNFAVEMRGMWDMQGDFMGGPFLSFTFVDQRHNRLVTLDGYVYNPNQEKKDLVRQLEAIIYTMQFSGKNNMETTNK